MRGRKGPVARRALAPKSLARDWPTWLLWTVRLTVRLVAPQLVLGNEEIGVDTAVMEAADGVIEIPCFGSKNSLNVCSAASIVVFEALRQWGSLRRDSATE